jgi:hypothetical protein
MKAPNDGRSSRKQNGTDLASSVAQLVIRQSLGSRA